MQDVLLEIDRVPLTGFSPVCILMGPVEKQQSSFYLSTIWATVIEKLT
jgi:hypothetical protein